MIFVKWRLWLCNYEMLMLLIWLMSWDENGSYRFQWIFHYCVCCQHLQIMRTQWYEAPAVITCIVSYLKVVILLRPRSLRGFRYARKHLSVDPRFDRTSHHWHVCRGGLLNLNNFATSIQTKQRGRKRRNEHPLSARKLTLMLDNGSADATEPATLTFWPRYIGMISPRSQASLKLGI